MSMNDPTQEPMPENVPSPDPVFVPAPEVPPTPVTDVPVVPVPDVVPIPSQPSTAGAVFPASEPAVPGEQQSQQQYQQQQGENAAVPVIDPLLQPLTPEQSGQTAIDPAKSEFPVPAPASGGRPGPDTVEGTLGAALPVPAPASGGRPGPDIAFPEAPLPAGHTGMQRQEPVIYQSPDTAIDGAA